METKHPKRIEAEKNYKMARRAWELSTQGTDEAAYLKADAELESARRVLVDAEMAYPTQKETARRTRRAALSSRGLDV